MKQLLRREFGDRVATISHSTRTDGDLSPSTVPAETLTARRGAAVDQVWHVLHQVHSDRVIRVDAPQALATRPMADALVTSRAGAALAVHSGDCVPIGFIGTDGAVGAAHAGWKGLERGVLEATIRAMRNGRSQTLEAAIGPHIRADRYAFGDADLARLARRFGDDIVGETSDGRPALDLPAAVRAELKRLDVEIAACSDACTARDEADYWSHRARKEDGRIALVAWIEEQ